MWQHPTTLATVAATENAWRAIEPRHALFEGRRIVKTVRLEHLRAALLAVAAAGLLAAAGLVVIPYAQPAEANYPGKPGKIAYVEENGTNFVIYTIKANGKGKVRLTAKGANNRDPAYGPGGKRIAYSGYDGKDYEIWTIKPKGGGKHRVTNNASNDRYPYWGRQ